MGNKPRICKINGVWHCTDNWFSTGFGTFIYAQYIDDEVGKGNTPQEAWEDYCYKSLVKQNFTNLNNKKSFYAKFKNWFKGYFV